jgi:branched-chain amino acid transport system ATP-binding protein
MVLTPTLQTENLTIRFGGHVAVDAVSCAFHVGTLTAIVGPNGAGKTTYFNLISGQLAASGGTVRLDGLDISSQSAAARARKGIGRAFQITNLFPNLSALENVRLAVQARHRARTTQGLHVALAEIMTRWNANPALEARARELLDEVNLSAKAATPVAALPHGDKRKLEVALMMALEPHVFMFDEPTAGMSIDEVPVVLDLIKRLKARGNATILLVEHKMDVVRSLADRIVVLHNGRLVADGPPADVIASPIVQEAYLGVRRTGGTHG